MQKNAKRPVKARMSARDVARLALTDLVRHGAYAATALDRQLSNVILSPEDRRLATSIFYIAAENRLQISYQLDRFLETSPEPLIEDILHVAAAQILFLSRVPDHAAVDEAVKQVKAANMPGLTGLVNGVLRNLIRARDAGELTLPDRETDLIKHLSVKYSFAENIVVRLIAEYGAEEAERIMAYSPREHRQTVRFNAMKTTAEAFEKYLENNKVEFERGIAKNSYNCLYSGNIAALEGYRNGYYSLQGESSMLAAYASEARPGMNVLDACAAPGGKSVLMAEMMNGSGRVYAWDVHEHRVELIRSAARRLRLENLRPAERDARKPFESFLKLMDVVLVDAPCSGLGVIADKPDIKYRLTDESINELIPLQRDILSACSESVKPGGLLIYSTCTLLKEENECQVRGFLEAHPDFEPYKSVDYLPEQLRKYANDGMIQILPDRDGIEGFFIARMRRKRV